LLNSKTSNWRRKEKLENRLAYLICKEARETNEEESADARQKRRTMSLE